MKEHSFHKTKTSFFRRIVNLVSGKKKIDDDFLDEIELMLIQADIGVDTTLAIIENFKKLWFKREKKGFSMQTVLQEVISDFFAISPPVDENTFKPLIILVVGVNGVGKTTTVAKLAHHYTQKGKKVVLAASDTYRAAAIEQLTFWAEKSGVRLVAQKQNSDPAAVAYDAVLSAQNKQDDVVIIDTAGRLQNKLSLMKELSRIKNVIAKLSGNGPHEILLTLDATTGQHALEQCKKFQEFLTLTGVVLTKIDGTAKGGTIIAIAQTFRLPIRFMGSGEKLDDLVVFNPQDFIENIFAKD